MTLPAGIVTSNRGIESAAETSDASPAKCRGSWSVSHVPEARAAIVTPSFTRYCVIAMGPPVPSALEAVRVAQRITNWSERPADAVDHSGHRLVALLLVPKSHGCRFISTRIRDPGAMRVLRWRIAASMAVWISCAFPGAQDSHGRLTCCATSTQPEVKSFFSSAG